MKRLRTLTPLELMALASKTALESPDPYKKVGCLGIGEDGGVVAFGYNSILDAKPEHMGWDSLKEFMSDRDKRRPFMVHAETMMCSLVNKEQIKECYTTLFPCVDCMKNLAAHGVKKIVYMEAYEKDKPAFAIAKFYGIQTLEYKASDVKEKIQQP